MYTAKEEKTAPRTYAQRTYCRGKDHTRRGIKNTKIEN